MSISNLLISCKHKVEFLLKNQPSLRDSDKKLWLVYMNKYHNLKDVIGDEAFSKFKILFLDSKTPSMETTNRIRRKFQENGEYVGTKRDEKLEEEQKVRNMIGDL